MCYVVAATKNIVSLRTSPQTGVAIPYGGAQQFLPLIVPETWRGLPRRFAPRNDIYGGKDKLQFILKYILPKNHVRFNGYPCISFHIQKNAHLFIGVTHWCGSTPAFPFGEGGPLAVEEVLLQYEVAAM